jgi:hypothetical protein
MIPRMTPLKTPLGLTLGTALALVSLAGTASAQIQPRDLRPQPFDHVLRGDVTGRSVIDIRNRVPARLQGAGCWFFDSYQAHGRSLRLNVTGLVPGSEGAPLYHVSVPQLEPRWNNTIQSVNCDHHERAVCHVTLFSNAGLAGPRLVIRGDRGLVNLTDMHSANLPSSLTVVCSERR